MGASLVHEDKVFEWGASLGDSALGQAIYANPKLKARAAQRMARIFGISDDHVPSMAPSGNSLLSAAPHSRTQSLVIASFLGAQDRFANLAGLVRLGGLVRSSVTPEMFQTLSKSIGSEELKLAARISRIFDVDTTPQLDIERINEHISSMGDETVIAWRSGLNGADRAKIDFALGTIEAPGHLGISFHEASEIMLLISAELESKHREIGGENV